MQPLSPAAGIEQEIIEGKRYPLDVAAELIPMPSKTALYQFLFKNKDKFPNPVYQKVRWYEVRLLTGGEILRIREMIQFGFDKSRYNPANREKQGRPGRKRKSDAVALDAASNEIYDPIVSETQTHHVAPRRQSQKTVLGPIARIIAKAQSAR